MLRKSFSKAKQTLNAQADQLIALVAYKEKFTAQDLKPFKDLSVREWESIFLKAVEKCTRQGNTYHIRQICKYDAAKHAAELRVLRRMGEELNRKLNGPR